MSLGLGGLGQGTCGLIYPFPGVSWEVCLPQHDWSGQQPGHLWDWLEVPLVLAPAPLQ